MKIRDNELKKSVDVYGAGQRGDDSSSWRKYLRRKLIIAGILATGLVVIIFGAKKSFSWYKDHKLGEHLQSAQIAARLGDWPRARNYARTVLISRPDNFPAFRIWQRALAEMEEPRAYIAAANLFVDVRSSEAERLDAFKVLALQAPQAVALSAYGSFDPAVQRSALVRSALSNLLILRHEYDLAERLLREVDDLETSASAQLALLKVLCAVPTPERVDEARAIFEGLIGQDAEVETLEALRVLGDTPGGLAMGPPLPPLPEWVARQSKATVIHSLYALHPEIDQYPEKKQSILEDVIKRWGRSSPGLIGTWLIRHDEIELAINFLEATSGGGSEAFTAHLHALLRKGSVDEIDHLLKEPPPNINRVDLELIQVGVARFRDDPAAETSAWNRAMYEAVFDTSRNRFIEIAEKAQQMGVGRIVERAWVAAVRVGWGRLPLYNDLRPVIASLGAQDLTLELLAIFRSLVRLEPQNVELLNNYYYLALLHDLAEPSEVLERLLVLASENESMPELYSAAAMAALKGNEPGLVFKWLPKFKESGRVSPTMVAALHGVALIMSGKIDEGELLLGGIDWDQLLNQEVLTFRELLVATKVENLILPELPEPANVGVSEDDPGWKKAIEQLERDHSSEILPPLPLPRIPQDERDPANAD